MGGGEGERGEGMSGAGQQGGKHTVAVSLVAMTALSPPQGL